MAVITLSRQLGSHGEEIAILVAKELGLRLIDAETINRAAQKAGVPQVALAELESERQRSLTMRMLNALRAMPGLSPLNEAGTVFSELPGMTIPFTGLFSPTVPPLSTWLDGYVRMVGLVIQGLAREGNVLILGRGGQALLRNDLSVLHVQVVAPLNHRIAVVMRRQELSKRDAQNRIRTSDRARLDYLRRYHDAAWLDATLYHLTINTGCVPVPVAADLIVAAEKALSTPPREDGDATA
ncbi:MAG TPA: cytidylate kinase-like family protein [Anaerolineae bacterium]|nr:cytidylate kinase-like family protein [Anaerolineae bacterium]